MIRTVVSAFARTSCLEFLKQLRIDGVQALGTVQLDPGHTGMNFEIYCAHVGWLSL
ncbi:MAG: hypothetical protein R3C08_07105 [Hyphomonas sp.]